MAMHLASSLQTLTGCQIVFEHLKKKTGLYLFEPGADDTFILIATKPLIEGDFFAVWQAMMGLASYHLAIPPGDFRRLLHIEAAYRQGHLIGPYHDQLNLDSNFISLAGTLMQQAGICPMGYCNTHMGAHFTNTTEMRFWSTRENSDLRPTISGDMYRIIT
jgi:hypothetical protein